MLSTRLVTGLPRLAWCATVTRGSPQVQLVHGETVEVVGDTFIAGAWDGPFAKLGLFDATTVMGSGGRATDRHVAFCNATHPYDDIYSVRVDDAMHVSNSLPLLLAHTDDGPDINYRKYQGDRVKAWRLGTAASPVPVPTRLSREVLIHTGTDLTVSRDLELTSTDKPIPPEPHGFAEYRTMLAGAVRGVIENASDRARHHPLRTLSTLSSGYDAAVGAVLGAEAGLKDAISFTKPGPDSDSGKPMGEVLGLHVVEYDTQAWRHLSSEPEIEFAASASGTSHPTFAVLDDGWNNSLVLHGSLGDDIWDVIVGDWGEGLSQPGAGLFSPAGLHEYALRAGVVFFAVPTIGAVHFEEIRRITESDEMAPWIIGVPYERPIPRRIIEEAGVPRGSFATHKRATAQVPTDGLLGPDAAADFERFWHAARASQTPARRLAWRIETATLVPLMARSNTILFKIRGLLRVRKWLREWMRHRAVPQAYRFHWAVNRLIDRYASELRAAPPDSRPEVPADSL